MDVDDIRQLTIDDLRGREKDLDDQIFRLTYDGQVADEQEYAAMGGDAEAVSAHLKEHYAAGLDLDAALRLAVTALGRSGTEERTIPAGDPVMLLWASADRDEDAFADAGAVRLDRSPNRHLTFGLGVHHCLGATIARTVTSRRATAAATARRSASRQRARRATANSQGERR